ncbi:MAG: diadenylate cyclase CdaA [Myxococcota bacterium]
MSALLDASWVDWIDIAALAIILYRVLVVMQGTRAFQSLLGLGMIGVVYLVSDYVGLTAVHWVLDKLFVYVVIAVLILFQDDIRRALARAGGSLFGSRTSGARPSDANVMEEVIKASFSLAHRRIGALIVIERAASLEPYVEGAHPIDGVVSTELLQTMFHPSSPLHDGAVVIANGRIVAAGVFLPISLSKELSRAWGTRHRAAIGLSEETDGLCVVVSEERGTVTLVSRGEITPIADTNDLRQRLVEKLGETPATEREREKERAEKERTEKERADKEKEGADAGGAGARA